MAAQKKFGELTKDFGTTGVFLLYPVQIQMNSPL